MQNHLAGRMHNIRKNHLAGRIKSVRGPYVWHPWPRTLDCWKLKRLIVKTWKKFDQRIKNNFFGNNVALGFDERDNNTKTMQRMDSSFVTDTDVPASATVRPKITGQSKSH